MAKTKSRAGTPAGKAAFQQLLESEPVAVTRRGLPASDSVDAVKSFTASTPSGQTFQIIRTNETDAYDKGAQKPLEVAVASFAATKAVGADDFAGTARKAAKLSLPAGPAQSFADVSALIASLPKDASMVKHKPKIATTAGSGRTAEEKVNIKIAKAFIYAASRESDNDFHLIVGNAVDASVEQYMTMELSGLPPANSAAFAELKAARDAYSIFFKNNLPGTTYDFYHPPVPVAIEGAIFFDMTHATGAHPGPQSLKSRMPTIWEVHPISSIQFE
jgi:hypothetical protein